MVLSDRDSECLTAVRTVYDYLLFFDQGIPINYFYYISRFYRIDIDIVDVIAALLLH